MSDVPSVRRCGVDLKGGLRQITAVVTQAARREDFSVPESDQCWIPAPPRHIAGNGPFLGGEVEDCGVLAAAERIVVDCAAGGEESAVRKKRVATTEEVEWFVVRGAQRRWVREGIMRWTPHDAGEDSLALVAEYRAVEAGRAASRAGEKQHLALREQCGVYGEDTGMEVENLP